MVWVPILAGIVAVVLVLRSFGWWRMRARLLTAARAQGMRGSWRGPLADVFEGHWSLNETNVQIKAERGGRTITLEPHSLGWQREDPPWTWWWIGLDGLATTKRFSLNVRHRRADNYTHPAQRERRSGDAEFDAAVEVYSYDHGDAEATQRNAEATDAILCQPEAREILRSMVVGGTDSISIHSMGIRASRRRVGATIEDANAIIDGVSRLADLLEATFRPRLYR